MLPQMELSWFRIVLEVDIDLNVLRRLLAGEPHLVLLLAGVGPEPEEDVVGLLEVHTTREGHGLGRTVDDVDDVVDLDGYAAGALTPVPQLTGVLLQVLEAGPDAGGRQPALPLLAQLGEAELGVGVHLEAEVTILYWPKNIYPFFPSRCK